MADDSPSAASVYTAAQAALAFADAFIDQTNAFWTTAVDGGFHLDGTPSTGAGDTLAGFVPVTNPSGVTTYQAGRAKLVSLLANANLSNLSMAGVAALNQRILRRKWFLETVR